MGYKVGGVFRDWEGNRVCYVLGIFDISRRGLSTRKVRRVLTFRSAFLLFRGVVLFWMMLICFRITVKILEMGRGRKRVSGSVSFRFGI